MHTCMHVRACTNTHTHTHTHARTHTMQVNYMCAYIIVVHACAISAACSSLYHLPISTCQFSIYNHMRSNRASPFNKTIIFPANKLDMSTELVLLCTPSFLLPSQPGCTSSALSLAKLTYLSTSFIFPLIHAG